MNPRLVLFDVDGTLIDTAGAGRRAMERVCREMFGIDGIESRTSGVRYAGMTDPVILEHVALAIGVDSLEVERRIEELQEGYLNALQDEMTRPNQRRRILPGVLPLLQALEQREDAFLGLITGNFESGARAKLEPFGLNRFFPDGGFSSDHRDRPEIARLAWRKLSRRFGVEFPVDSVVVVGDTEHDVTCARANGFRSIAVESGWVSRDKLERAQPDVLLTDLVDRAATLLALGFLDS